MPLFATLLALAGARSSQACLDVRSGDAPVALAGRLESHIFPGPPNYTDTRQGDRTEGAYILRLDHEICIDDGGDFADPRQHFGAAHIFGATARMRALLHGAVGHRIRVSGRGFAANTAHHREPLVVDVRSVRMEGR